MVQLLSNGYAIISISDLAPQKRIDFKSILIRTFDPRSTYRLLVLIWSLKLEKPRESNISVSTLISLLLSSPLSSPPLSSPPLLASLLLSLLSFL